MTDDDELIRRARGAYDQSTFDCPVESLQQAAPALFRAVDERDAAKRALFQAQEAAKELVAQNNELRKKYEPCMPNTSCCSRGTCYECVTRRAIGFKDEADVLRQRVGELETENFALAAAACVHVTGVIGSECGTPLCPATGTADGL